MSSFQDLKRARDSRRSAALLGRDVRRAPPTSASAESRSDEQEGSSTTPASMGPAEATTSEQSPAPSREGGRVRAPGAAGRGTVESTGAQDKAQEGVDSAKRTSESTGGGLGIRGTTTSGPHLPYRLASNRDLEVRSTSDRGRAVYWAPTHGRPCKKGTVLLTLDAHVSVLSSEHLESRCHFCASAGVHSIGASPQSKMGAASEQGVSSADRMKSSGSSLRRCSGCKRLRYCSTECQRADWAAHRPECRALQAYSAKVREAVAAGRRRERRGGETGEATSDAKGDQRGMDLDEEEVSTARVRLEPGTSVRAMARMVWGAQRTRSWRADFTSMQSHRPRMTLEQSASFGETSMRLAHYLAADATPGADAGEDTASPPGEGESPLAKSLATLGVTGPEELLDLCCRVSSNSFTACTAELDDVGLAVSPTAALFNHSCMPNAVVLVLCPSPRADTVREAAASRQPRPSAASAAAQVRVVAIADIEPDCEVTTAYLDLSDSLERRQGELRRRYFFECRCRLCRASVRARRQRLNEGNGRQQEQQEQQQQQQQQQQAPLRGGREGRGETSTGTTRSKAAWIDPRDAMWCETRCGGWVAAPSPNESGTVTRTCAKCGRRQALDSDAVRAMVASADEARERGEASLAKDEFDTAWRCFSPHVEALSKRFVPSAYPLFSLLRSGQLALLGLSNRCLQSAAARGAVGGDRLAPGHGAAGEVAGSAVGESEAAHWLEAATRLAAAVVAGAQAGGDASCIYPRGHPSRALALLTLGKLLVSDVGQAPLAPSSSAVTATEEVGRRERPPSIAPPTSTLASTPPLPPANTPARLWLGRQTLAQALDEARIGFGGERSHCADTAEALLRALEAEMAAAATAAAAGRS